MKIYKKIMNVVTLIEKIVLILAVLAVLVLTFGNVIARYIFQHSWGFTEEIVVAVFVLISLLASGVAARGGEHVNLALLPDNIGPKGQKVLKVISTVICIAYSLVLAYQGWGRMQADATYSPILHIPKTIFWSFVFIGGISMALHFLENCIDFCMRKPAVNVDKEEEEGVE